MGTKSDEVIESADATVDAPTNTLGHYLIVRHAFDSYRKGDAIRDEATIKGILADAGKARSVHRVIG
jgi:hypothetical protein